MGWLIFTVGFFAGAVTVFGVGLVIAYVTERQLVAVVDEDDDID